MTKMRMKEIFKLSFKYALSNKKAILSLGILIIIKEFFEKFLDYSNGPIILPVLALTVFIYIYFVGFVGYFVEEVISNPDNPPKQNTKRILRKGINEVTFFTFYLSLSAIVYMLIGDLSHAYPTHAEEIETVKVLISSFINLFPMAAMINVFLHDEKARYGFKIKEIANLILNLRASKFIWIIILSLILEQLFVSNFTFDKGILLIYGFNLILNLVLIPFLYIFLQFVKTIAIIISNENKYQSQLLAKK